MFRSICGILLLISISKISCNELNELTQNFFDNLEIHLKDGFSETDNSITFMNKQVGNFVNMITKRHNANEGRIKRQVAETSGNKDYAIHLLEGVSPLSKIPVKNPKDLALFQHVGNGSKTWYAAALQEDNKLLIFKHNANEFKPLHERHVRNGVRLGVFTTASKGTYIVVAENTTKEVDFELKTSVYLFTIDEQLEKIQNLHLDYASDVVIWSDKGDLFMAITQQYSSSGDMVQKLNCETQSTVYKWLGGHFDIVQHINTSCAVKVTPFSIGKSQFIAIANRENNNGNSDIFSEVFKYDLSSEKFISYQKILTRGAADIKFFAFRNGKLQENFIIVANSYAKDELGGTNHAVKSIVYKLVDGYFLPFQSFDLVAVTEWLPSVGPDGQFVLLAACKFEGAKIYQYNGWKFVQTPIQYTHEALSAGIQSMHSYQFNGKPIIVVANNKNEDYKNTFELHFKFENQIEQHYNNMLKWCESTKEDMFDKTKKTKRNVAINLRSIEADLSNDTNVKNNLAFLELQLENQEQQINIIEKRMNGTSAEQLQELHIMPGDLIVRNVIINNEVFFNELIAMTLNRMEVVGFLSGIIAIDQVQREIRLSQLEIQSVTVDSLSENMKAINGHSPDDLLHRNVQNKFVHDLIVRGNLIVGNLQVKGTLNSIIINSTSILLKESDQVFRNDLNVQQLNAKHVSAIFLNNLNLLSQPNNSHSVKINEIENLKVKNLIVAGYMNNLDLPTLDKYALKTSGNQEITAEYLFDELHLNNLHAETLNGFAIPDDLVQITHGEYFVHQDVQLSNDLKANNLIVGSGLNQIQVHEDGTLDVLLKNTSNMQFIEGKKIINEVELLKPMNLQGKITSDSLEELNPLTKINDPIELVGNFVINGNVTIEAALETSEIATEDKAYSIGNLKKFGLKLTDTQVPVKLNFTQQLNTFEIFVDNINGIDTHQWVVNGNNDTQYLKGWKTFEGDLVITGNTDTHIVNQIPLPDLEANTLKVDGDQKITGKHEFKNINVGPVRSNHITLNSQTPMEAMLTNNIAQEIPTAFIGQLSIDQLEARNVQVDKNFNNVNFIGMLEDTLFKEQNVKITGAKHFENLTIVDLTSRKSINMNRIPNLIKRREAITGSETVINLPDGIIENIRFKNYLNNLSAESFQENWLDGSPTQKISGDQVFDKVVVFGNLMVDSNRINDLNLRHLVEDTVKVNEDHDFEKVTFNKGITSLTEITLLGHIENLDIDSILADNGEEIAVDSLTFKESVTLLYPANVEGSINGFNFTQLCQYAEPVRSEGSKHLIIEGNALIVKDPIIKHLNGEDLQHLTSSIWYNDMPANLTTNLKTAHINFHEDITVDGFIDETNLEWLRDNYFSKTANQTITAAINFQEGISIKSNLRAPSASVQGNLNDINLDEFVRTAILQRWDQTFEQILFVESCKIDDLQGNYKVNGLNLKTDVMRYDADNIVTGKMIVQDVDVEVLNVERDFKVQDVDLKYWTQKGVLRVGSQKVDGRIVFSNFTVFEKGVGLTGLLNHNQFTDEKVMLKSKPQTITGHKVFVTSHEPLLINHLKLKGTLNDIQFSDLLENQALKIANNSFANEVDFHTNLVAQNVNFEGLFQGVNVTQLLQNLTQSAFLENYYENYIKLKEASVAIQKSLNNQATYLTHFRTIQHFNTLVDLVPIKSIMGSLHLATLRHSNHTQVLDFFKWSANTGVFSMDTAMKEITFSFVETIRNWAPLEYDFGSYLYVEVDYLDATGNTRMGNVLSNQNTNHYEIIAYIPNNGTKSVLPIFLPKVQKTCLLLNHLYNNYMDIYCQGEHVMQLHQRLPIMNALQVEIGSYDDHVEIIAIEKLHDHMGDDRLASPSVVIWSYDKNTELFNEKQRIYTSTPISISATSHNGNHYLAIASGHLMNTMYAGQIDVKKYDPVKKRYVNWQIFRANAPVQVEFALLPSNELLLYVLRNNPTETLLVYQYTGIGKFEEIGAISTMENCNSILPFTDEHLKEHFIIAKCNGGFDIIQSVFKS